MSRLIVPSTDRRLYLFSLSDVASEGLQSLTDLPTDVRREKTMEALLGGSLSNVQAELLQVNDLRDMGLASFLMEAHEVEDKRLHGDKAKLSELSGSVLTLRNLPSQNQERAYQLHPSVTLINSYDTLAAAAATPQQPRPLQMQARPAQSNFRLPSWLYGAFALKMALVIGVTLWVVLR